MKRLFNPAIIFMNRLRYPGRLMVTGTLAFVAVATLLVSLAMHLHESIEEVDMELASLDLIKAIHKQIQLTQEHRGISATYLSGDGSLLQKLESRQAQIEAAMREVDRVEQRYSTQLRTGSEWHAIKQDWQQLRHAVKNLTPPDTLRRHGNLIERMLRFQLGVADAGHLTLDNKLNTFYLGQVLSSSLPEMLERLGKMRARGSGILVRKSIGEEERVAFSVQNTLLKLSLDSLSADLAKISTYSPELAHGLDSFSREIGLAIALAVDMVDRDIMGRTLTVKPEEFFDRFTDAINIGYREMFDTLIPTLAQQLELRNKDLRFVLWLQIGLTTLFLLLLLYVSIGAYYSIIESVNRLSAGATRIAEGDLAARIQLDGRDELTDVALSFNTMAVALDKLLRDSRQINAELTDALAAAQLADRAKDAFLANVSHELRTPLNAVIGLAELAGRPTCTADKRTEYMAKIVDAGKTLSSIINDLLDLSKIAAGRMELDPVCFRFRDLVEHVVSIMSYKSAEQGLQLRHQIDQALPDIVIGDNLRIEQVMLNMLSNAIKFTHAGHVELRAGLVSRRGDKVRLKIEVEDTGIGMSEEEAARLFLPFTQVDASMSRKYGGTGLGLALCRRIAELMNGKIEVSSKAGVGSTFRVEIELEIGDPAMVVPMQQMPDAASDAIRYEETSVLVVDDQPMNREIVQELLSSVGITVQLAENGQQALKLLFEAGPAAFDLVLMDIQMPVLDGLEATRRLRERADFRLLPVIAMTAHTMEHEKEISTAAGMVDHIGKPVDALHFYSVLRRWIPLEKQRKPVPAQPPEPATAPETKTVGQQQSLMDRLGAIKGLNAIAGLSRFGAKEERYLKWLAEFISTGKELPQAVLVAMANDQVEVAAKAVHAFKGRVGTLGMEDLHAQVVELEHTLRSGVAYDAALAEVSNAVDGMIRELEAVLVWRDGQTP